MKIDVDARGLSCPQPVINTKKALDSLEAGTVVTVVDNAVARDNVCKLAESQGCVCNVQEQNGLFTLTIIKGDQQLEVNSSTVPGKSIIFVTQEGLGQGSEELGRILIKSFFYTIVESNQIPQAVMFVNGGVKLACSNSPILEHLQLLAEQGTEILSCGTCLDFFKIKDQLQVGEVTNMYTILEKLQGSHVINI